MFRAPDFMVMERARSMPNDRRSRPAFRAWLINRAGNHFTHSNGRAARRWTGYCSAGCVMRNPEQHSDRAITTRRRRELAIRDIRPAAAVLFGTVVSAGVSAFATMRAIPGGRFGGKVNSMRPVARRMS
jgi:hypothetical protein